MEYVVVTCEEVDGAADFFPLGCTIIERMVLRLVEQIYSIGLSCP